MHYVMSDIHGHRERFESVMRQIDLQPKDKLYILGDVIDRNPHGISILQELMKMPNVRMLIGNHEQMMLDTFGFPDLYRYRNVWYRNGGSITHEQINALPEEQREEILTYLRDLPLNIKVQAAGKKFLLVHGAPAKWYFKWYDRYNDKRTYAVWMRMQPYMKADEGETVIFGHTPTCHYQDCEPMQIWYGDGIVGIDCGAAYGAECRLCCLRLEDMKVFYSET